MAKKVIKINTNPNKTPAIKTFTATNWSEQAWNS
jgi:hypothetical protein